MSAQNHMDSARFLARSDAPGNAGIAGRLFLGALI